MTCNPETLSSETRGETRNDNDDFDRHIARRLHSLPLVDTKLNQLGYSTDGVRSTVGTRHIIFYVWVFSWCAGYYVLYHTKPCRDTLTNRPIWTEMYGTL